MSRVLVIFDLDDTLIQTSAKVRHEEQKFLASHGIVYTDDEWAFLAGAAYDVHMAKLRTDYCKIRGHEAPESFENNLIAVYRDSLATGIDLTEGAEALLCRLQAEKIPFCIASNSTEASLPWKLWLTGLDVFFGYDFNNAFSKDFVERPKPAPDLCLYAAQEMETDPARCIFIGDSAADMLAAKAAGMYAIGFTGGAHRHPQAAEYLAATGADITAPTMEEAQRIVLQRVYALRRVSAPSFSL